jgi:hypothetical protein
MWGNTRRCCSYKAPAFPNPSRPPSPTSRPRVQYVQPNRQGWAAEQLKVSGNEVVQGVRVRGWVGGRGLNSVNDTHRENSHG